MIFQITAVVFIALFVAPAVSVSLYSPDDPLHELDKSNFDSVVYKKNHAWLIEFYSSWCGHCIRFAPKWKQFVRDIETWRAVVDVGVVNCADSQNIKLCRDHNITGYPTIKLYEPYINETAKGENIKSNQMIESIETDIVNFLETYQTKHNFIDWPNLKPFELSSVRSLTRLIKKNQESLVLILEHPDSSVGMKVILDLSFQSRILVQRALMTNQNLLNSLKTNVENSSLLVALKIYKSGKEELLFRFPAGQNSTYIRDQIFLKLMGSPRGESEQLLDPKSKSNINVPKNNAVHMTDLENALRYMLYQEIGVVNYIYGDRLVALKSILQMLKDYFPGKPHVIAFLSKVNDWVATERNITGESFIQKLDEMQTDNEYLPAMKDYVSCKGSEPRYRGYPCSLWTMFHTLTVSSYIMDEESAGDMHQEADTVLPNIKKYIRYFFTCEECVENFFTTDHNIDRDYSSSRDVVLWLWTAHNQVNRRLAGDITEDPQHPKIQFPSQELCPKCRLSSDDSGSITWDEFQVLRFLRSFYGKKNIVDSDDNQSNNHGSYTSGNTRDLKLNQYFFLNLLLWILRYAVQRMDSDQE